MRNLCSAGSALSIHSAVVYNGGHDDPILLVCARGFIDCRFGRFANLSVIHWGQYCLPKAVDYVDRRHESFRDTDVLHWK